MKKIGLLSDTHNFLHPKINYYFKDCDEVWHAGDIGNYNIIEDIKFKKLRAVYGNIDGQDIRLSLPKELNFKIENVNIYITHIGGYPENYSKEVKGKIKKIKPNLVICGHSHILKVMYDKELDILHMNPGACGDYGQHKVKTIIRFCIDKKEIKELEIVEIPKKLTNSICIPN